MPILKSLRVAIIGAGAAGILAAINLRECGIKDILVFEKGAELGGTWRDNQYPGVACDVPSHRSRTRIGRGKRVCRVRGRRRKRRRLPTPPRRLHHLTLTHRRPARMAVGARGGRLLVL